MEKYRNTLLLPALIIILGVLMRLFPHVPNFAPITAIALFGGIYLDKKYALVLPLVIMLISDYFLGFHDTMLFVYGSFIISGLLGLWARKNKGLIRILTATLCASIIFFLITNFGVWLTGHIYPKTAEGLIGSFVMAIPFFRNTILGDLVYTTTFVIMYKFFIYLLSGKSPLLIGGKK